MSQSSHSVGNVSAPAFRAAMNDSLQALASLNSGATAPSTTYANMLWYDTASNILYMRSEADDAWIALGTLNQSTNTFTPAGSLTLASQAEAEAGTDNTKVMTPLRVVQSIVENTPEGYTDAQARAAQAGHSVGGIGSYGFFLNVNYETANNIDTIKEPGHLEAGSNLRYSGADPGNTAWAATPAPAGTWRLMGRFEYRESSDNEQTKAPRWSVYLRVS